MQYPIEDLVPIVATLANRLTGPDSTSITYEKAEQLMEAVIYCINEFEHSSDSALTLQSITALTAYESGLQLVQHKTKDTLSQYNHLMEHFNHFDNRCLMDTVAHGLPEFFKWYDVRFCPQNTILTLDYPILRDLTKMSGIDRIHEYINCICIEQYFLHQLSTEYVISTIKKDNPYYKDAIENICEIVLEDMLIHILAEKPLYESSFSHKELHILKDKITPLETKEMRSILHNATHLIVDKYYSNNSMSENTCQCLASVNALKEYLIIASDNISARIRYRIQLL